MQIFCRLCCLNWSDLESTSPSVFSLKPLTVATLEKNCQKQLSMPAWAWQPERPSNRNFLSASHLQMFCVDKTVWKCTPQIHCELCEKHFDVPAAGVKYGVPLEFSPPREKTNCLLLVTLFSNFFWFRWLLLQPLISVIPSLSSSLLLDWSHCSLLACWGWLNNPSIRHCCCEGWQRFVFSFFS